MRCETLTNQTRKLQLSVIIKNSNSQSLGIINAIHIFVQE